MIALNGYLDDGDFAAALQVGQATVEHETMLCDITVGRPVSLSSRGIASG